MFTPTTKAKRLRGIVMQMAQAKRKLEGGRFDEGWLWDSMVKGLGVDVGQFELRGILKDLCARGYITYRENKDKKMDSAPYFTQIELTPRGSDLLEETFEDPAVEL